MTPFREPAESPTATALARLASLPSHPLRRACAVLVWYREVATAPATAKLVRAAEALGFSRLGCAAEGTFPRVFRKQIFVDTPRTTQAHLSTHYFFVTYFESGKCIITWDHQPQTPSSERLRSRATAGSFEADYAAHGLAVKELAASDTPIVVADLRTAVALGRFYYRQVASLGIATLMLVAPLVASVALGTLIWRILTRGRG